MSTVKLSDGYSVCGQIEITGIVAIADAGFKSVINNRPAGEQTGQPEGNDLEKEARRNGMVYAFNPVSPKGITDNNVALYKQQIETLPKPILAFCRTGNRSKMLFEVCKKS